MSYELLKAWHREPFTCLAPEFVWTKTNLFIPHRLLRVRPNFWLQTKTDTEHNGIHQCSFIESSMEQMGRMKLAWRGSIGISLSLSLSGTSLLPSFEKKVHVSIRKGRTAFWWRDPFDLRSFRLIEINGRIRRAASKKRLDFFGLVLIRDFF